MAHSCGKQCSSTKCSSTEPSIPEISQEHLFNLLAYSINKDGKKMVQNLDKISNKMKELNKKILKEKISMKRSERSGRFSGSGHLNLSILQTEYNSLIQKHNRLVTELQEKKNDLVKDSIKELNEKKKKKRKRRQRRRKTKKLKKTKKN